MNDNRPLWAVDLEELLEAHFIMLEEKKKVAERSLSGFDRDEVVGKLCGRIKKAKKLESKWKKLQMEQEETIFNVTFRYLMLRSLIRNAKMR
jgi:hypothetical protein